MSICGNCYFILTLLGVRHETVAFFCTLNTVFDNKLRWDDNIGIIVKKCPQCLYFLRKLNPISVDKTILNMFYKSFSRAFFVFLFIC